MSELVNVLGHEFEVLGWYKPKYPIDRPRRFLGLSYAVPEFVFWSEASHDPPYTADECGFSNLVGWLKWVGKEPAPAESVRARLCQGLRG